MRLELPSQLYSTGSLAALLQRSPGTISAAARLIGVPPALIIDGREYFDDAAVDRLRDAVTSQERH
jgi:hypothetical protein